MYSNNDRYYICTNKSYTEKEEDEGQKANLRGGRFTSSDGVAWGSSVERDDRVFLFFVFLIFGLFLLYHTSRTGGR